MRPEFIFTPVTNTTKERDDYFTKMALCLESVREGTIMADGSNLQEELNEEEKSELLGYVIDSLEFEMKPAVKHYSFLDYHQAEDMGSLLKIKLIETIHTYNNPNYLKDKSKRYSISTFVSKKASSAMRDYLSDERNLPVNAIRNLRTISKIISQISAEEQIIPSAVTPEQVMKELEDKSISYKMVVLLMEIYHGAPSIDEMEDSDERLKDTRNCFEKCFHSEMDDKTKKILDDFFDKFSHLELFLAMKGCGVFGEAMRRMEVEEMMHSDYFIELAKNDVQGKKYVTEDYNKVKNVLVEAEERNFKKFSYNKVAKVKHKMLELGKGVLIEDLEGNLETYFLNLWQERTNAKD